MVGNRLTPTADLGTYLGAVQVLFDRWRSTQREVECGLELGATDTNIAISISALQQLAQAVAGLSVPTSAVATQQALFALMGSQIDRYLAYLDGRYFDYPPRHNVLEEIVAFGYELHQLVIPIGAQLPDSG